LYWILALESEALEPDNLIVVGELSSRIHDLALASERAARDDRSALGNRGIICATPRRLWRWRQWSKRLANAWAFAEAEVQLTVNFRTIIAANSNSEYRLLEQKSQSSSQ
jgi:hypothetical protein